MQLHLKHNSSKHCPYLPLYFTLFVLRIFAFHGICIGCACFEFLLSLRSPLSRAHTSHLLSLSHCSFCMSSGAVSSRPRPRHPSLSLTDSLTLATTHSPTRTDTRIQINKRLSVSMSFEKSNSNLFCQAHSPPPPELSLLLAYGTTVKN